MTAHELLARAFREDPLFAWAEPDLARRERTAACAFEAMLRYAARVGGHWHEPGVGSVHWRDGRYAHMGPLAMATTGMWKMALIAPPSVWTRLSAHEDAAMRLVCSHLDEGAVYLCTLGVEPSLAGQGHGSRLLRRALSMQASQWSACLLRTEQPRNVPFYLRHGFELIDERVVAVSGLRTWVFRRSLEADALRRSA